MFESGKLDQVNIVNYDHYVLLMRPDINTHGTCQWFYFSVSNTTAGLTCKFEIVNFTRKIKLYHSGMKIWILSKTHEKTNGIKWYKDGEQIQYIANEYKRKTNDSIEDERTFYTLSFEYKFKYDNDTVFFSYTCPYTYSDICSHIAKTETELQQRGFSLPTKNSFPYSSVASCFNKDNKQIINHGVSYTRKYSTQTVCGIPVYEIAITANSKRDIIPEEKRKCIVITSRVHAGESTSSLMLEGFLNFLFSKSS